MDTEGKMFLNESKKVILEKELGTEFLKKLLECLTRYDLFSERGMVVDVREDKKGITFFVLYEERLLEVRYSFAGSGFTVKKRWDIIH